MARVAVLGSTGMLGSTLTRILERDFASVTEFNRSGRSVTGANHVETLDVLDSYDLFEKFNDSKIDYIINAIGMIKQLINEEISEDVLAAHEINSHFMIKLNEFSAQTGVRVIQIGTDCVYSGMDGSYSEEHFFDPTDTYGKTKNIGEQASSESMIIRSSIIGKEKKNSVSLLSWVLSQPEGAKIKGYVNHFWNGVTTLHFSEIISGIIKSESFFKGVAHLVPSDAVSKFELIRIIAREFGRADLEIQEFVAENRINRTLVTVDPAKNLHMWQEAGYNRAPTIQEMVSKYASWTKRHG
jgi:dTDP-4-dehydrorhamnose reductase